jgi:prepilin-type N-terminal cleavage/methylation domain-containing protein
MKPRGFTLLELVVALTLLGVLAAVLADGLSLAARTSRAVQERATRAHEVHVAMHFLARQAERAQTLSGEHNAMRFAAGTRFSAVFFEDGELRLVQEGMTTILARGLEEARFAYFERDGWRARWDAEDGLPRLVRVTLAPGGELVIAPRLHAPRPL